MNEPFPVWLSPEGQPVACVEKIKVMNENLSELQQLAQDAFEDTILMGCDPAQVQHFMMQMMQNLQNPYIGRA